MAHHKLGLCILRMFGVGFADTFLIEVGLYTKVRIMHAPPSLQQVTCMEPLSLSTHVIGNPHATISKDAVCNTYAITCDLFVTEHPLSGEDLELRAAYDAGTKTIVLLLTDEEVVELSDIAQHPWSTYFDYSGMVFE